MDGTFTTDTLRNRFRASCTASIVHVRPIGWMTIVARTSRFAPSSSQLPLLALACFRFFFCLHTLAHGCCSLPKTLAIQVRSVDGNATCRLDPNSSQLLVRAVVASAVFGGGFGDGDAGGGEGEMGVSPVAAMR